MARPTTRARKSPRTRVHAIPGAPSGPPPAAFAEAVISPAVKRTLRDNLALITGALVADLVMAQGKTVPEAAEITGFSVEQLRADGLEFAMGLVRALDPELAALMDADTPETEAAHVSRIVANAHATAHAPTMV